MSQDTLLKLSLAKNYNKWIYQLCAPYLGQRILEVGCGVGNMTEQFIQHGHAVLATDIDAERISKMQKQWCGNKYLTLGLWDVTKPPTRQIIVYQPAGTY